MLTFEQKTIYRRNLHSRGMHKARVTTVHLADAAAILELAEHEFVGGEMKVMHYPSTVNGFITGVRIAPGQTLYKDADGNFGMLISTATL